MLVRRKSPSPASSKGWSYQETLERSRTYRVRNTDGFRHQGIDHRKLVIAMKLRQGSFIKRHFMDALVILNLASASLLMGGFAIALQAGKS